LLRILRYIIIALLIATPCYSAVNQVSEEDGSPSVFPWKIKFNNGSVTNNGDGTVSISSVASVDTIPTNPTASGSEGMVAWNSDYLYICIADNSWKRVAFSEWIAEMFYLQLGGENLQLDGNDLVIY
jgi:hypothetical protein